MMQPLAALITLMFGILFAGQAAAQSMDMKTGEPSRVPASTNRVQPEVRACSGGAVTAGHQPCSDPRFVERLSTVSGRTRVGVAGWTAPSFSPGSRNPASHEASGWPTVGVALEWGSSRGDQTMRR